MALGHKITTAIVVSLALAAWVVMLAGIAAITENCYSGAYGADQVKGTLSNCRRGLQYEWWGCWFEFIVLILILGFLFAKSLFTHATTLLALLAIVTSILMYQATEFMVGYSNEFINYVATPTRRNVAAAGWVMCATFNCFLIFLLGSGFAWFGEEVHTGGAGGVGGGAPYGKGGAAAAARPAGPNFSQPATFASPLSGGGARAYLPNSPGGTVGEPTVSAVRE